MLSTKSILATVEFCESEAVLSKELYYLWYFPIGAMLRPLYIDLCAFSNCMLSDDL